MDENEKPRRKKLPSLTGVTVVEIKWIDSAETIPNEELTAEQLPLPQIKYSAGYLLDDEPEFVRIAGIINEHGTVDWVIAIPRCSILDDRRRTR